MKVAAQLEQNKLAWIDAVKGGDSRAVEMVYRAYRTEFVNWLMKTMGCDQETALDIFQESVLALYKNAKAGRIDELGSSIKTYLFAIGRRCFMYQSRQNRLETNSLEEDESVLKKLTVAPRASRNLSERQNLISSFIAKLRPTCQELLSLFYYENLPMRAIAEQLNYRNVNVAKVMKARCMESLRKLVGRNKQK